VRPIRRFAKSSSSVRPRAGVARPNGGRAVAVPARSPRAIRPRSAEAAGRQVPERSCLLAGILERVALVNLDAHALVLAYWLYDSSLWRSSLAVSCLQPSTRSRISAFGRSVKAPRSRAGSAPARVHQRPHTQVISSSIATLTLRPVRLMAWPPPSRGRHREGPPPQPRFLA